MGQIPSELTTLAMQTSRKWFMTFNEADRIEQGEWTTVENAQEIFYNDLPSSMVDELAAKLLPHAASIYTHPLAYAGYKYVPTTYLLCTQDQALPFKVQKAIVASAHGLMRTEICDAGHFCMLSMPERVTNVIIKAAGVLG